MGFISSQVEHDGGAQNDVTTENTRNASIQCQVPMQMLQS